MTATAEAPKKKPAYDPDEYRMSIGEHLEELRRRVFLGLGGVIVAIVICAPFGKSLLGIIVKPLVNALIANDLNPQLFTNDTSEVFMCWVQIVLIAASTIAGPWLVYQLWQFVATGLYPNERKTVTKYIPLAIALLLSGMAFVYFIVLPLTMRFFIGFAMSIPLYLPSAPAPTGIAPTTQETFHSFIQPLAADPDHPLAYQWWFNTAERRLKFNDNGAIRTIPFGSNQLMAAHFAMSDYLDLVLRLLLTFGLCFQLPLVVLALAKIGIVDVDQLKLMRRYVYFGMTVLAAAVSPGDVVTATLALLVPLIFLYELGIFLAKMSAKNAAKNE